jgi:hypothetical protein
VIEWKEYGDTRETQPPSHEPFLVVSGEFVGIAIHQIDRADHVYKWFANYGTRLPIRGVTHYAEINRPKVIGNDRIT